MNESLGRAAPKIDDCYEFECFPPNNAYDCGVKNTPDLPTTARAAERERSEERPGGLETPWVGALDDLKLFLVTVVSIADIHLSLSPLLRFLSQSGMSSVGQPLPPFFYLLSAIAFAA